MIWFHSRKDLLKVMNQGQKQISRRVEMISLLCYQRKAGFLLNEEAEMNIRGKFPYVAGGGLKIDEYMCVLQRCIRPMTLLK